MNDMLWEVPEDNASFYRGKKGFFTYSKYCTDYMVGVVGLIPYDRAQNATHFIHFTKFLHFKNMFPFILLIHEILHLLACTKDYLSAGFLPLKGEIVWPYLLPPAATDFVRLVNIGHTLSNVELGVVLKMPKNGHTTNPNTSNKSWTLRGGSNTNEKNRSSYNLLKR